MRTSIRPNRWSGPGPGGGEDTDVLDHLGWIEANADRVREAMAQLPAGDDADIAFTAHSIPLAMAAACRYEDQLRESVRLVAEAVGAADTALVYQSRSGSPSVPWLEPDILDHLHALAERGVANVVISPLGFISDHLEVIYDLDVEARGTAAEASGSTSCAPRVPGTHPAFVGMIRELDRGAPRAPGRTRGRRPVRREPRCVPGRLLSARDGTTQPVGARCRALAVATA